MPIIQARHSRFRGVPVAPAVVSVLAATSCAPDIRSATPAVAPVASPLPASIPSPRGTAASSPGGVDRSHATSPTPSIPYEDPTVEVTTEAVFFHDIKACALPPLAAQPLGSGEDCKGPHQEHGLSMQALVDVVKRSPDAPATAQSHTRLLFAAKTPYRVFLEVLFTAGQLNLLHQEFAVRTSSGQVLVHVVRTPVSKYFVRLGSPEPPGPPVSFVNVTLDPEGATFLVADRPVGRGCLLDTPGPTVPSVPRIDFSAVANCARSLLRRVPNAADESVLTASLDTPAELVLETVSTLRCGSETCLAHGAEPTDRVFDNVLFKVPRFTPTRSGTPD